MKKRLLKIFLYAVVFVAALELFAHANNAIDDVIRLMKSNQPDTSFDSIKFHDEYGTKGLAYGEWDKIKLNKFGFNDSDNYDKIPNDNTIRIMCLGDSVTFGTFTAPVNWPDLLEKKLISQGLDVEVINAAFPGNIFPKIIKRFEAEYLDFKPHYLLALKDCRYYMAGPDQIAPIRPTWTRLSRHSSFFAHWLKKRSPDAKRRLQKRRMVMGIKELRTVIRNKDIAHYENDMKHLIDICKNNGIVPVPALAPSLVTNQNKDRFTDIISSTLCYYPSLSVEAYLEGKILFNNAIKKVAHKENVPFVDLPGTLDSIESNFTDDYHLTIEGAEKVAAEYAKALLPLIKNKNGYGKQ